ICRRSQRAISGFYKIPEKSNQGDPTRSQHVPFSGLVRAYTRGKSRVFAAVGTEVTGETDWPAEQERFELLVPLRVVSINFGEEKGRRATLGRLERRRFFRGRTSGSNLPGSPSRPLWNA